MIPGDSGDRDRYKTGIFGFQISTVGQNGNAAQQMPAYVAGASATETAEMVNDMQKYFLSQSRLGIPIIPFDEALHGLVRQGQPPFLRQSGSLQPLIRLLCVAYRRLLPRSATPSWSKADSFSCGKHRQRRSLGAHRGCMAKTRFSPRQWALPTSRLEKMGIITTPKHFLANVGDGGRDAYPIHFNERLLREIYLPPLDEPASSRAARAR